MASHPLKNLARIPIFSICAVAALVFCSCEENSAQPDGASTKPNSDVNASPADNGEKEKSGDDSASAKAGGETQLATFGGGCFWCTEAVMERLEGVVDVKSGYMGGHVDNPTYEQVCEKTTGHVEVIQVAYNPKEITFDELLDVFWQAHDPTSWDQQGNDKGPQYRSVVFTHSAEQKAQAESSKKKLNDSGTLSGPVVTEIRDADTFWEAEGYHQDFYSNNPNHGYCRVVISPKLKKLKME